MPEAPRRSPALPAGFGLIRTVIPGATALDADDLARAAALSLARELGVSPQTVRLAVRRARAHQASGDDCLIAWVEAPGAVEPTPWLALADGPSVFWFDAPGGFAVGPGGVADLAGTGAPAADGLPTPLLMLIAASRGARDLVLVAPAQAPDPARIALWEAASGLAVRVIASDALPEVETVDLRPPPAPTPARGWTAVDHALATVFVASVILLAASLGPLAWRLAEPPTPARAGTADPAPASTPVARGSSAGALLQRTLQAAPTMAEGLTAGDYADGRWVLTLRRSVSLAAVDRALSVNGLASQSVAQGDEVRLRVERRRP